MLTKLFKRKSNKTSNKNSSKRDASLDSIKEQFAMSTRIKNLPPRFAEQLLFLEMEMEQDIVDLNSVKKLLELYASAIEYYESQKSDKYFIFKNKTQSLLLKPNVSAAMLREQMKKLEHKDNNINDSKQQQSSSQSKQIKSTSSSKQTSNNLSGQKQQQINTPIQSNKGIKEIEEKKIQTGLIQQQKEHNLKVQYINAQDSQENAKIMLCQHKQEQNYTKTIITGEIKNQTNEVLKRLEQRRKSKLEKIHPGALLLNHTATYPSESDKNNNNEGEDANNNNTINNDDNNNSFEEKKKQYESSSQQENNLIQLNNLLSKLSLQNEQDNNQNQEDSTSSSSNNEQQSQTSSNQNLQYTETTIASNGMMSPMKEKEEVIDLEKLKRNDYQQLKKKRDRLSIQRSIDYSTPNKENKMENANVILVDKVIMSGFSNNHSNNNSYNRNNNGGDSPILIKMNSYNKTAQSPQLNLKWMTASTNHFHTPFSFN